MCTSTYLSLVPHLRLVFAPHLHGDASTAAEGGEERTSGKVIESEVKITLTALVAMKKIWFGMHTRQSSARFRDSGPVHSTAAHQCCTECQSWLGSRASEADFAFQLPERHSSLLMLIQSEHSIDSSRFVDFRRAAILLDAYLLRALQLVTSSLEVKVGAGRAD